MSDIRYYWDEDELIPMTEAGRVEAGRTLGGYDFLRSQYGLDVVSLWIEMQCPESFNWTEIVSTG